jgi:hydroxymethylpyrimidine pyrophosphatase-like HAD family hydrolase
MGIPNIMFRSYNAAAALLEHRIGAHIIEDIAEFDAARWLNKISLETKSLSLVGLSDIFDINIERRRVIASITEDFTTVVTDFDGTIFHKESPELTSKWVSRISKFDCVILCSARGIDSLLVLSNKIGLHWDAVVSYSGALLTTKGGNHRIISEMKSVPNGCSEIRFEQHLLQAKFEANTAVFSGEFRQESYSGTAYWLPWKTTKLRGALLAISHFSKVGRVVAFGDGKHDIPLIQFFGGKVVTNGLPADNEVENQ